MLNQPSKWRAWLRAVSKDPSSPARVPAGALGALTGQDARALDAIVHCWFLYSNSDDDGVRGSLNAVRALLPAMQPQCRYLARELIAFAMDWDDRERVWSHVEPRRYRFDMRGAEEAGWKGHPQSVIRLIAPHAFAFEPAAIGDCWLFSSPLIPERPAFIYEVE